MWLKGLVGELGIAQDFATVYCDSLSAICLVRDQVYHDQTKHIDVRFHFLHTDKRVKVKKTGIADNLTDFFTESVIFSNLKHCLDLLNIDNYEM